MPGFSLKVKLLLFTLTIGLISMLLAGYLVDRNLLNYHERTAKALIEEGFSSLYSHRKQLEASLVSEAQLLREEERVVAILNLINNFQDTGNYHSILFDEEKKRLAQRLQTAIQTGRSSGAYLYAKDGHLVSFAQAREPGYQQGYLSFQNSEPLLQLISSEVMQDEAQQQAIKQEVLQQVERHQSLSLGQRYFLDQDQVYLEQKYPVVREHRQQEQQVGYLVMARRLDVDFLMGATRGGLEAGLLSREGRFIDGQPLVERHAQELVNLLPDGSFQEIGFKKTASGFWGLLPLRLGSTEHQAYLAFVYPVENYYQARSITREAIFTALLVTALLIIPFSLLLVRELVTQPLQQLMRGVEKIRQGSLLTPIDLEQKDELGKLATAMNEMANQLHQREQSLNASNLELQRLSEVMAHHFQEPTRRLMVFAERLENRTALNLDKEAKVSLAFIYQQAEYLSRLVHDVQNYLELERVLLPAEHLKTAEVLEKVLAEKEIQKHLQAVQARVHLEQPLPDLYFSRRRLEEIFRALLTNALIYRHPERTLELKVFSKRVNDCNLIYIADNGQGIAPRHRLQVFELFSRLVAQTPDNPGTGMGLALVRRLMRQAGGDISIEDGIEGGTAFVLSFPNQELETNDEPLHDPAR